MKSTIIFTLFAALAAAQVTRDNDGYDTTSVTTSNPHGKQSSTTTTSVSASVEHYPAYSAPSTTSEEAKPTPDQSGWGDSSAAAPTGDWASASSVAYSGWPETDSWASSSTSASAFEFSTSGYAAVTSSATWTHSTSKAVSTSSTKTTSATASAFTGAAVQGKDAVFGFGLAVAGAGLALVL